MCRVPYGSHGPGSKQLATFIWMSVPMIRASAPKMVPKSTKGTPNCKKKSFPMGL